MKISGITSDARTRTRRMLVDGVNRANSNFILWATRLEASLLSMAEEGSSRALSLIPLTSKRIATIFTRLGERSDSTISDDAPVLRSAISPAAYRTAAVMKRLEVRSAARISGVVRFLFGHRRPAENQDGELHREIGRVTAMLIKNGIDAMPAAHTIRQRVRQLHRSKRSQRKQEGRVAK